MMEEDKRKLSFTEIENKVYPLIQQLEQEFMDPKQKSSLVEELKNIFMSVVKLRSEISDISHPEYINLSNFLVFLESTLTKNR